MPRRKHKHKWDTKNYYRWWLTCKGSHRILQEFEAYKADIEFGHKLDKMTDKEIFALGFED